MDYQLMEKKQYRFHYIKTNKFKTVLMRVNFKTKIKESSITERDLLAGVLSNSTKDYPTLRELVLKKEDLYQLVYGCSSMTSGNYIIFQGQTKFIHEKYTEEGMNETSIRFFFDSLFSPNIEGNGFSKDAFSLEKRDFLEFLEGKNDEPNRYSSYRFNQIIGENTPLAFDHSGDIDILKGIDEVSLYQSYLNMLEESVLDIFFIGDMEVEEVTSIIDEYVKDKPVQVLEESHFCSLFLREEKEEIEPKHFKQSKLKMGFTIDDITPFEREYVLPVYHFILGGDSDSLLFQNIREKNSLCYDVHSNYYPIYGFVRVSAGIEAKDYEKTVSLVKEQVRKMALGEFDEKELDKVKLNYKTSFKEIMDSPQSILNVYESHEYLGYDLLEDRMKNWDKVTKEMVVSFAKRVNLVVTYFLEGNDDEKEIKDLDLFLYEETLDNGLTIYVIPKENTESIYVTFTTKFGGYHTEFIPREENDFIKVPDGIAHFLEHKMFEQKSGMDVMSQFSKNGVSANASTNLFKTTYLFDGSSFLKENLTLLLDYVQDPYFTDENVEKEKHIIEQEIDMSADNPYQACMQTLMKNLFVKDPSKVPTIGTKKSINEITKEDLYTCYQTFYHPKNMFLVVTGNIDPKEIIELVKENQKKKTFEPFKEPVLKTYDEPTSVFKEKEERFMKITVPKLALGYKFDLHALKEKLGMSDVQIRRYLSIYANLKFGAVSPFLESARKDMVITSTVDYSIYSTDDHIILMLMADTKNPEELIHRIEEELKNEEIEERLFNLKKKGMIASTIYMSENIYSMNQKVMGDIIDHQDVEVDVLSSFKALDYESFMNVISSLQFNHRSISFVRPEKSEE